MAMAERLLTPSQQVAGSILQEVACFFFLDLFCDVHACASAAILHAILMTNCKVLVKLWRCSSSDTDREYEVGGRS